MSGEGITMFKFERDQVILEVNGVKVGGQPGQLPTVMIGSIFYHGHKIVENEKKGYFNKAEAEKLLMREEEISAKTGNPRIVDVCCSWPSAFEKFIEFVADIVEGPFAIDGTTAEVRIAGAKYVSEVGLSERVIYNSITPHTRREEILAIKDSKIKVAILLTLNARDPTIKGRMGVIDKLLNMAKDAGIEKVLVDTTVLDVPDPGPVSKAIYLVKSKYGLPAGAGLHNAIDRWKKRSKLNQGEYALASAVANAFAIFAGANFILYGPIENAEMAYFACSLADAYVAYSMMQEYGIRPLTKNHPLFKIFIKA